jgi:hypothetical protein
MFLVRLVYASRIAEPFSTSDIEEVLESARKHNKGDAVTGVLCFNRKFFLQCLEGGRMAVNNTYHRILNDPRHKDIVLLDYKEVDHREFSSWGMAYIPEQSITDEINLLYSRDADFDPYTMTGEGAHQMMLKLSSTLPVV